MGFFLRHRQLPVFHDASPQHTTFHSFLLALFMGSALSGALGDSLGHYSTSSSAFLACLWGEPSLRPGCMSLSLGFVAVTNWGSLVPGKSRAVSRLILWGAAWGLGMERRAGNFHCEGTHGRTSGEGWGGHRSGWQHHHQLEENQPV